MIPAAEAVARELEGLADEMRAQAEPGAIITVDFEGALALANALTRAVRVLRGELLPAQLLVGEYAPPAAPPVEIDNLVIVDFCGRRWRAAMGMDGGAA